MYFKILFPLSEAKGYFSPIFTVRICENLFEEVEVNLTEMAGGGGFYEGSARVSGSQTRPLWDPSSLPL